MKTSAKTALITGTSSGIGAATIHHFAREGWNVVGTTRRNENNIIETAQNVRVVHMEQSDEASVAQAVQEAADAFGKIDILVNNAGYCLMGQLEGTPMAKIRRQYDVNYFGVVSVTQAALPYLKKSQGGIINIASISAENGYPFNAVYSSSKAAVVALTEGLNIELSCVNVFAKAVLPGYVATDIFTKLDTPDRMPEAYRTLWQQFVQLQSGLMGFDPQLVARCVFEAATNGDEATVRYYPTPDAAAIPKAKRLLGLNSYWRMFRKATLNGPNWLQRKMTPQGTKNVSLLLPENMK